MVKLSASVKLSLTNPVQFFKIFPTMPPFFSEITSNSMAFGQQTACNMDTGPVILKRISLLSFNTRRLAAQHDHFCSTVPRSSPLGPKTSIFWRQQGQKQD